MYDLPRRYAALTERQMDFWDALYYLAYLGGGRMVVSSQELANLTGLDRKKITPLLKNGLERGELHQDTPLAPPGPWHYELIIANYHTEADTIPKPLGYVANGWLRVVRPALPKRLLNHLLHLLDQAQAWQDPLTIDPTVAGLALRKPNASTPIPHGRLQDALDALIRLGLVRPLPQERLILDLSRFDAPAPVDTDPEEKSALYRQAHTIDPLRAQRALSLIHSGNLVFARDFEQIFQKLAKPVAPITLSDLRQELRSVRHLPREQRWTRVAQRLDRQATSSGADFWPKLRQRAWRHTQSALENLKREKYRPNTYVPRPTADAAFVRFQHGHRPALALVGQAGVGKSNTLCHWAEETLDQGHAVMFYLAPTLSPNQDLLDRLAHDLGFSTLYTLLSTLYHPGHHLYVFIDALNEASAPLRLAATLNAALQSVAADPARPSLRFLFSCRQGLWEQLTRRGLLYPTLLHGDRPVSLGPFDTDELVDAYARYREHYDLQNDLPGPGSPLRRLLRIPLFLALTADTYRSGPVPTSDLGAEVIDRYLAHKLPDPTQQLLLRRIVALMAESHALSLPLSQLWTDPIAASLAAQTDHDAPYPHLLSEGLIAEHPLHDGDTEIRLTYERVFEHLLAQMVLSMPLTRNDLFALMIEATSFPALRNAAIGQLSARPDLSLVERLASDPDPKLRGLARDVLITRHEQGDARVPPFLEQLADHADPTAVHTGLAVALERRILPPILDATTHPDQIAREQGVLYIYYLWRRDREKGWQALRELSGHAVGRFGLPRRRTLTTLLQASTLIMLNHLSPETTADLFPLIDIAGDVLSRIPLVGGRSALAARARSALVAVGGYILDTTLKAIPLNETLPVSSEQAYLLFENLYGLPAEEKQFLSDRLDALDPERNDIQDPDVVQALLELFRKEPVNALFGNIAIDALASYHLYQPAATRDLVERMLNSPDERARAFAVFASRAIAEGGYHDTTAELAVCLNDQLNLWENERTETKDACFGFARTMMAELRAGRQDPTLPDRLLEPAWTRQDPDALVILLYSLEELAYLGYPLPALRAMRPHFEDTRPSIRTALVEILRRLAVLYPDDVYFFLEQAPLDLQDALQAGQAPAILWGLIGRRAQHAWSLLFTVSPLRRFFLDLLRQTLSCPDWPAARRRIIEQLIEALIRP